MIAAFPEHLIIEGLDALEDDQLFEPRGSNVDQRVTDIPMSGERKFMEVQLPTAVYNEEVDEVTFETRPYNYPYYAKV